MSSYEAQRLITVYRTLTETLNAEKRKEVSKHIKYLRMLVYAWLDDLGAKPISSLTSEMEIAMNEKDIRFKYETTLDDLVRELVKATEKFPEWPIDPIHACAILGEEFGELQKEVLQLCYEPAKGDRERVRKEAIQTLAMAARFLKNLDTYYFLPGKQKLE